MLEKQMSLIEESLTKGLKDADTSARKHMRKLVCAIEYMYRAATIYGIIFRERILQVLANVKFKTRNVEFVNMYYKLKGNFPQKLLL